MPCLDASTFRTVQNGRGVGVGSRAALSASPSRRWVAIQFRVETGMNVRRHALARPLALDSNDTSCRQSNGSRVNGHSPDGRRLKAGHATIRRFGAREPPPRAMPSIGRVHPPEGPPPPPSALPSTVGREPPRRNAGANVCCDISIARKQPIRFSAKPSRSRPAASRVWLSFGLDRSFLEC